jgi:branched-chain amino acid transport system ATP-binding protein
MKNDVILNVEELSKSYGALKVTNDVNLTVNSNQIHALIGPNGAGKTSLISQLSGHTLSDSGRVWFDGHDITHTKPHARVHVGLVRSFQITRLFKSFTVLDNVALALQAKAGHNFSFWRPVSHDKQLRESAHAVIGEIGLDNVAHSLASDLSHGEQRILELGLAFACEPKLLLLDEPMAGTGQEESARIVSLIQKIRKTVSILLVEHDMDAVFSLADVVSVLVNGQIIASASPDQIKKDPLVIQAYLGDEVST